MIENSKGKTVNPAVVEHMAMENERLREMLRECCAYLEPVHDQFMRAEKHEESSYVAGANLHAAIDAALSQQAEPALAQDEREIIGVERYRVVMSGGNFGIACVKAGDGERTLYQGHISDCERVAAELATAFEDGKFVARRPAQAAPQPEQSGLVEALAAAAQSLEAISNRAGEDEFMQDMADVRSYARSRAGVARAALSAQGTSK